MLKTIAEQWETWAISIRGIGTLAQWRAEHASLADWSIDNLRTPVSSAATDEMQTTLIQLAHQGQSAAAMTLIVQLRPGLEGLVRRTMGFNRATNVSPSGRNRDPDETRSEVVGVFSEVLMSYRIERRPHRVAANLLLDTWQRIWRDGCRQARLDLSVTEAAAVAQRPDIAGPTSGSPQPDLAVEALDVVNHLSQALASLSGSPESRRLTAQIAYRAWILDQPTNQIAADLDLKPGTVNTRLCRLRQQVQRHR